jgi:hypothetical protein
MHLRNWVTCFRRKNSRNETFDFLAADRIGCIAQGQGNATWWLRPVRIGEYTGEVKQIRPATVPTCGIPTRFNFREEKFKLLDLLRKQPWAPLICDEMHMMPASVYVIRPFIRDAIPVTAVNHCHRIASSKTWSACLVRAWRASDD